MLSGRTGSCFATAALEAKHRRNWVRAPTASLNGCAPSGATYYCFRAVISCGCSLPAWLGLEAAAGRYFVLSTASLSALGYEHNLAEPAIRLWNDDRHVKVISEG